MIINFSQLSLGDIFLLFNIVIYESDTIFRVEEMHVQSSERCNYKDNIVI